MSLGDSSNSAAIRGWGCTPTGDPPAAAVNQDEPKSSCLPAILTRGWRRNALYGILVVLMILVFLNIALTLWIISAMRLSMKIKKTKVHQIDRGLKWESHIDTVCSKIGSACFALRRVGRVVPAESVRSCYFATVHSLLQYGAELWGRAADWERAFRMQKRAVRAIARIPQDLSAKPHFQKLGILTLPSIVLFQDGVGPIKIVKGGIQLNGQAWILDRLVASSITSQLGHPITLHSHRNFTVLVSDPDRGDHAKFMMKKDSIEFSGRTFDVRDSRGGRVFHASKEEVRVYADTFAIDSEGGLTVQGAMQVPFVRAPPGSNLQLESLTRKLELRAPQSIYFESRAGSIDVSAHGNIKLDSTVGAIKLDASNIIIDHLKEAPTIDKPQRNARNKVYQLCACASGKLFLAAPDAVCAAADDDTELCR